MRSLGSLCMDAARGARFWEEAGRILLERTDAAEDSEIAFERALIGTLGASSLSTSFSAQFARETRMTAS